MIDKILLYLKNIQDKRKIFKNWYLYYLPFNKGKTLITKEGDNKFMGYKSESMRCANICTLKEVYFDKIYTKYFDVDEGDIVVDIGANIGAFSIYVAKKAEKVFSFESSENFKYLKENITLNNAENISAHNEIITIGDVFRDYDIGKIDFLKIDLGGNEYETLFTTPRKYFEKINKMSMELYPHSKHTFNDMIKFLWSMEYKTSYLRYGNWHSMMVYARR